ncbi:MAG: S-adenosylmethionine decarboxylase family protein [Rubripirellula sp.]
MTASPIAKRTVPPVLGTGMEWVIDAFDCDCERLRDLDLVREICDQVIQDLGLKVLGDPMSHRFGGPGGVTALYMLTESHLACHTYPEFCMATFNLYCCRVRPEWDWSGHLQRILGAGRVETRQIARGLAIDPLGRGVAETDVRDESDKPGGMQ